MRKERMHGGRLLVLFALVASCAAACSSVQQAVNAPVNALKGTDVVVEQNLQTTATAAQDQQAVAQSFSGFGTANAPSTGIALTTGASIGPGSVSYSVAAGGVALVLAAYNHVTNNCLGMLLINGTIATPILGTSQTGSFDFTAPHVFSSACNAGAFAVTSTVPSSWPGPPSTAGWPKP